MSSPAHTPLRSASARALQRLRQPLVGHTSEGESDPSRILQYISDHRRELMPFGAAAVTGTAASLLSKKGNRGTNFAKGGIGGYIAARLLQGAGDLLEAEARQARAVDTVNRLSQAAYGGGQVGEMFPDRGYGRKLTPSEMNSAYAAAATKAAISRVNDLSQAAYTAASAAE